MTPLPPSSPRAASAAQMNSESGLQRPHDNRAKHREQKRLETLGIMGQRLSRGQSSHK